MTETPPEPAEAPQPRVSRAGLVAARLIAAVVLIGLATVVLWPFITPLAWGAILAYVTWPIYRSFPGRVRRPAVSAALLAWAVAVVLGIPVALLLFALADEATTIARGLLAWQAEGAPLPAFLADNALAQSLLGYLRGLDLFDAESTSRWLGSAGSELSRRIVALAGGVARNALKFTVAMVSLYVFYVSGERLIELGRRLAPLLFPAAPARFIESIGESVRAVMFGLMGTGLAQGLLAGIGLAVAGVPSPVALGAATVVLSVLPGGGGAITLASAAWLALGGHWAAAIGLGLWGVLVVSSMDNLLRPVLISGAGRIPFLLVFLGILGGLGAFGLIGLFVGPVILSVAFTLLVEFSRLSPRGGTAETDTSGAAAS